MKRLFFVIFFFLLFNFSSVSFAATGTAHGTGFVPNYVYQCVYDVYLNNRLLFPDGSNFTVTYKAVSSQPISVWAQESAGGQIYTLRNLYVLLDNFGNYYLSNNLPSSSFPSSTLWYFDPSYIFGTYTSTGEFRRALEFNQTSTIDLDITLQQDIFAYPPRFPVSTGMSYSTVLPLSTISYMNVSSDGVVLPSGFSYGFCDVTYTIYFNNTITFNPGSYFIKYITAGNVSSPTLPSSLFNNQSYAVSDYYSPFVLLSAFNFSHPAFTNFYFDVPGTRSTNYLQFGVTFFVTQNVSSFNVNVSNAQSPNYVYCADSNFILSNLKKLNSTTESNNYYLKNLNDLTLTTNSLLQSQNSYLTSASGANSSLNSQNAALSSAMSDYQRDTDTSSQYSNISDSFFVLDPSIFTSFSSTITLFSSCITSFFNSLGDLSVPLTLFLIITLVSCIIGIIKVSTDDS